MTSAIISQLVVPPWLRCHILEVCQLKSPIDGALVPFIVVSKDLEPRLPGFVGCVSGLPFISEEVPPEFREHAVNHELIEFIVLGRRPGSCLEALTRELNLVPADLVAKYIDYRRAFFERLVAYHSDPARNATPEFLGEITASLRHLKEITPQ